MTNRDLSFFMPSKTQETKEEKVIVSRRFVDESGNPIPFIIKPISTERVEQIEDECTIPVYDKKTRKKTGEKLDASRFQARISIESTVYPDFKSKELLDAYSEVDPVGLAKKVLSIAGEYAEWIRSVNRINGLDDDFNDLVEDAKNSLEEEPPTTM